LESATAFRALYKCPGLLYRTFYLAMLLYVLGVVILSIRLSVRHTHAL